MLRAHQLVATVISLALLAPGIATAAQLKVTSVTASSVLRDMEKGITYSPENMLDEESSTMWVEGEGSAGLGKYLSFKFDGEVELAQVRIWAGCFLDAEFWKRHNRLQAIEFKFPDFTSERVELKDIMEPQWIKLAEPKNVSGVKIFLRSVYSGSTWNDSGITAIQFFDKRGPTGHLESLKATASSVYSDEADSYAADRAVDGWLDTYWIEGKGSGEGEYLDVAIDKSGPLRRWAIAMGNAETDSYFKGNNRVGRVTLGFSDGSSQSFKLEDQPGLQVFDLKSVQSSRVRVTFSNIIKGKSHDDLYVAEVRFWD